MFGNNGASPNNNNNRQQYNRGSNNNNTYNNNNNNTGFGGGGNSYNNNNNDAPREAKPCRPLTIRQLYTAQVPGEGIPVVDGKELEKVTIVGRIVKVGFFSGGNEKANSNAVSAGYVEYIITDGTGKVIVKEWRRPGQASLLDEVQNKIGTWITVTGNAKHIGDQYAINGTITPIEDQNEITYHFLDCVLTHRRLVAGGQDRKIPEGTFTGLTGGVRRDKKTGDLLPTGDVKERNSTNNNNIGGGGADSGNNHNNQQISDQTVENAVMKYVMKAGREFSSDDVRVGLQTSNINVPIQRIQQVLNKMINDQLVAPRGHDRFAPA